MRLSESPAWRWLGCAAALAAAWLTAPHAAADRESRRTPVVLAVESAAPATVNITSTQVVVDQANPFLRGDPMFDEFFRRFMNPRSTPSQSLGTGVIINEDGYVLTN